MTDQGIRLRVLIAKPGLDGHDRGARIIARLLRDDGHEVIYTGLRQRPMDIVRAAIEEDVDVIGLSILSGAHMQLTNSVVGLLQEENAQDIRVIVGGTIPPGDAQKLRDNGVAAVFGVGTSLESIREWFKGFEHAAN